MRPPAWRSLGFRASSQVTPEGIDQREILFFPGTKYRHLREGLYPEQLVRDGTIDSLGCKGWVATPGQLEEAMDGVMPGSDY